MKKYLLTGFFACLLVGCGNNNEIIKETSKKCYFQIVGYDKTETSSHAIAKINNSKKLIQLPIDKDSIPKVTYGSTLTGACIDKVKKSGERLTYFDVKIPVEKFKGTGSHFNG
jgi:hypothetical protein